MDTTTKEREQPRASSRRAILLGAVGGLGAWTAAALGRAAPVRAADGEVVNVGDNLTGTKTTTFNVESPHFSALWGNSTAFGGSSVGVRGDSASGDVGAAGVLGLAPKSTGVRGAGVHGVDGSGATVGVYGESKLDAASRGVWGVSATGAGVRGDATSGIAVQGQASNIGGYAFRGSGRVRFDKVCGVATLAAGTTSKVITPGTDVTTDSFVLLTPGADIGTRRLWFTKDTTANTITIRMSSSRTSATGISWLLLR